MYTFYRCSPLLAALLLALAGQGTPASPPGPVPEEVFSSTFSIVAADPDTGVCGAAVASRFPRSQGVAYARGGVGAFLHHTGQPQVGRQGPGLRRRGKLPDDARRTVTDDQRRTSGNGDHRHDGRPPTALRRKRRAPACTGAA